MWFDSHCHVPMIGGDPSQTLADARRTDVAGFICVGCDVSSSRDAIALAATNDDVWASVGLHPHDAQYLDASWEEICGLVDEPRVVAVGETGLDFFYNHSPHEEQVRSFAAHIGLARDRGLALIVHVRDAWDALFEVFDEHGVPERTVLHCFTGGPEELARAVALGCMVSFSGIVSFANAEDVRAAARVCPEERLLVETDSPYLAPVPHRGSTNRPAFVVDVGRALAAARNASESEVAAVTTANAQRVFGLA